MVNSGDLNGTAEYPDGIDEASHKPMSLYPGANLF